MDVELTGGGCVVVGAAVVVGIVSDGAGPNTMRIVGTGAAALGWHCTSRESRASVAVAAL